MADENTFRIVLLVVFVVQTALSIYYIRRSGASISLLKYRQAGPLLTGALVVSYIAYVSSVLTYLTEPQWMAWSAWTIPVWARWVATAPLLLGGFMVVQSLRDIGSNLTISPSTKTNHKLITTGLYGWVRHPIYSGVLVESLGVCVLMANWFVSLCAGVFCALIAFRTRIEEDNLIEEFGDEYEQYQQRVGQFFPKTLNPDGWLLIVQTWPALLAVSILSYIALAAMLFGFAGRLDLPWLWATLIGFAASHLVMVWVVFRHDPGLTRERIKPGPGVPLWDKIVLKLSILFMLAIMAIALLDVGRWHWSDSVPPIIQGVGLLNLILGMSLMTWSMAVNTFFSKVVRIQDDRGHKVIDKGPYRFVRHPGYVGWTMLWFGFILAIGSWLAFGLSTLGVAAIVLRTYLEDRFLMANLDGYADYASRVKWRLIPGIW